MDNNSGGESRAALKRKKKLKKKRKQQHQPLVAPAPSSKKKKQKQQPGPPPPPVASSNDALQIVDASDVAPNAINNAMKPRTQEDGDARGRRLLRALLAPVGARVSTRRPLKGEGYS